MRDIINKDLYETDYYAWIVEQKELLKNKDFSALDYENMLEEISSLEQREQRILRVMIKKLVALLLGWEYYPDLRGRRLKCLILHYRMEIKLLLEHAPSMRKVLDSIYNEELYDSAKNITAIYFDKDVDDDGLRMWSIKQVLDDDFLPGDIDNVADNEPEEYLTLKHLWCVRKDVLRLGDRLDSVEIDNSNMRRLLKEEIEKLKKY